MAGKFKESLYRVFGLENVEEEPPVAEAPVAPTAPRARGKYNTGSYNGPTAPSEPGARTVRDISAPAGSYAAYSKPLSGGSSRGGYRATSAVPRTTPQPPAEAPTPLFQGSRTHSAADEGVQMIVYQLQSYDDTQRVVDELNAGRTVIVSTERLKTEIAQRALDFIGGAIYALNGNHRKIARGIFVFAPGNVDISGSYANVLPQEMRTSR